jgi:uncharacterized cupin superfamily protein
MPKIDVAGIRAGTSVSYPEPHRDGFAGRARKQLGHAAGLEQFSVSLTTLKPGAACSHRHWHEAEDELVYILEGEVVLCENGGDTLLRPGDAAGFKAGVADGHCLVNRTDRDAVFLEIGTRSQNDRVDYPDIDLTNATVDGVLRYFHRSGEPYPTKT